MAESVPNNGAAIAAYIAEAGERKLPRASEIETRVQVFTGILAATKHV